MYSRGTPRRSLVLVSLIPYLEVAEDVIKEIIDGPADASVWPPGEYDVLDSQQRDEDEGGSHRLHVGRALGAVGFFQLGDQDPDDVQEEEKVHLGEVKVTVGRDPTGTECVCF